MEFHYRHRNIAIYELINKETNWRYIDFSLHASIDTDELIKSLKLGKCPNPKLQADWDMYTHQAFKFDIIEDYEEDVHLMVHRTYNEAIMHKLYQRYLELITLRKSQGQKLYNESISPNEFEHRIQKLVTFNKSGDQIIKPYHQHVLLENGYNHVIYKTNETDFPPHYHEEAEIIYALSNNIQISLNQNIYELKPRDILIIGPKEIHSFKTPGAPCDRMVLIFTVPNEDGIWGYPAKSRLTTPHLPYHHDNPVLDSLHSLFEADLENIMDEFRNRDIAYQIAISAGIYHILQIISRQMTFESISIKNSIHYTNQMENLERIMRYVSTNYMNEISLQEAADISNYSVFYFTRFFKEQTGMTFGDFLNNYRIQRSADLLFDTNWSITEIAYKCGFNSIKTYNRLFKQIKNINPSAYRKMHG